VPDSDKAGSPKSYRLWLVGALLALMLVGPKGLPLMEVDSSSAASAAAVEAPPPRDPPPTRPQDWYGEIDYPALDARFKAMMRDRSMQGLAVAVVEKGRLSFVQGYGMTSAEGGEPVDADTVFRWASLSKTMAGTLAAKLAAEGVFSLNDPLATFHTTLRLPGQAEQFLTVEDLLAQRTGLPKHAHDPRLEDGDDPRVLRTMLGSLPAGCRPRGCHSYQNIAFDAVTEIIVNRTGEPFEQTVHQRLFAPLGMESATLGASGLFGGRRWAKPHRYGQPLQLAETYYRVPSAAGVNSSIVDLAVWMQAQMGLRPEVVPPSVLEEVHRVRINTARQYGGARADELSRAGYGLGMRSFVYRGHRLVGHSGAVSGYRSTMIFDPDTRTGLAMLWNSDANLPFRFQLEFFDRAYGMPITDRMRLKGSPAPIVADTGSKATD
jgi:beta-lactamase class C